MATNGSTAAHEQTKGSTEAYSSNAAAQETNQSSAATNPSKDEVGWYFVEQYYTTMSKSPEKLHLFYSKRSQFVAGMEAEVANVSVGRHEIQERVKQLDFQDCKVRVSNVDSQASQDNIVIQVIGEVSNKGSEPKKFVQTFVLAQQPSGYFVLNDILRYITEDVEEDGEPPAPVEVADNVPVKESTAEPEPETELAATEVSEAAAAQPEAAKEAAEPAELSADNARAVESADSAAATTTEAARKEEPPVEAPAAAAETASAAPAKPAEKEAAAPEPAKAAAPAAPTPATAPSQPAAAAPVPTPAPAEPEKPAKPMTWANRAAAAAGAGTTQPRPVVPVVKTATPPAPAQARSQAPPAAAAAAAAAASSTTTSQPAAAPEAAKDSSKASGEWQTAGADNKRQHRSQPSGTQLEKEGTMGYVKNVTEKVKDEDLRAHLSTFGELVYFDINRPKNCAFIEYATPAAYQAAASANPHNVNGESVYVEARRPKGSYTPGGYGSNRGGPMSGRGRGGYDGPRTAGPGANRGGYTGTGRGRGGAPRGRGTAQAV